MNITCLLGSPRTKGNSATIAHHFLETAENLGARVRTYTLNTMKFRGCQACMSCKTKLDHCAVIDDLTQVLDEIRGTDLLVLATPVYFHEISSQMKAFVDRTYSYFVPDFITSPVPSRLSSDKRLVFIQTQGQPDANMFDDIFPRYGGIFQRLGFPKQYLIRGCGLRDQNDILKRADILKEAEDLAGQILNPDS
jgi:multimeric flavodoxin WrbA